jgi:hypothetical protein
MPVRSQVVTENWPENVTSTSPANMASRMNPWSRATPKSIRMRGAARAVVSARVAAITGPSVCCASRTAARAAFSASLAP